MSYLMPWKIREMGILHRTALLLALRLVLRSHLGKAESLGEVGRAYYQRHFVYGLGFVVAPREARRGEGEATIGSNGRKPQIAEWRTAES